RARSADVLAPHVSQREHAGGETGRAAPVPDVRRGRPEDGADPRPGAGARTVRSDRVPDDDLRAIDRVQPHRAVHHARRRAAARRARGEGVHPTSDLMPPEPGELAAADARFAKNTAVMSVGTALSRLTGFLRLSFAAWAFGFTATSLADTYNRANI